MLERAGGAPYETLIQQRLFQPLGIAPTFGAAGAGPAPEAWGHTPLGVRRWSALDPNSVEALFPAAANPAGGAKLSGNELARYLQLHVKALRGDGGLLITPGNARIVHTAVQDGLALGWIDGADERRRPLSWHNGSDDLSYCAFMAMRMDGDSAAAVLVNAFGNAIETDINSATLFLLP